jgi:hypothetical protein
MELELQGTITLFLLSGAAYVSRPSPIDGGHWETILLPLLYAKQGSNNQVVLLRSSEKMNFCKAVYSKKCTRYSTLDIGHCTSILCVKVLIQIFSFSIITKICTAVLRVVLKFFSAIYVLEGHVELVSFIIICSSTRFPGGRPASNLEEELESEEVLDSLEFTTQDAQVRLQDCDRSVRLICFLHRYRRGSGLGRTG